MSIVDKMYFLALDSNFNVISVVDDYESVIWTERYTDVGDFEIHGNANTQLINVMNTASYILNTATYGVMAIEKPKIGFDEEIGSTATISGRGFESFLDRRIILANKTILNPADARISQIMCSLVTDAYGSSNPQRYWNKLVVTNDASISTLDVLESGVALQFNMGDNLLTLIINLATAYGIGFKCRYNPLTGLMTFSTYEGIDRTIQGNNQVIFSDSFDNLLTASDESVYKAIKNTILVIGNATDDNGVPILPTVVGDSMWQGLNRRETYAKIDQDKIVYLTPTTQRDMTNAEYVSALLLAGATQLNNSAYQAYKNFEGEILETESCQYGAHYNLGDMVLFRTQLMTDTPARLTEIIFSDDQESGKTVAPSFTYGV